MLTCPHCQSAIDDSDTTFAGATVACSRCGGHVIMPDAPRVQARRIEPRRRDKPASNAATWVALANLIVSLLALGILVFWEIQRQHAEQKANEATRQVEVEMNRLRQQINNSLSR